MKNLGQMFEETCRRYADNTALIYEDQTITYGALKRSVDALAHHFQALGLGKGDKAALMLPNCPEFVVAYFACQKIGAVAVTLNVLSTPYELSFLLADSDARVFITQPALTRRFEEIRNDLPLCRHLLTTEDLKRIATEGPFTIDIPDIAPDDPAVMIYTSGLTGKPLGAMLTHHNLLTQSALLKTICSADETFRGLAVIPHFHSFGAVGNMLSPMWVGAGVVLMERFTLDSIFKAIEKEKVTYIAAVPRLFMGMVFHDKADQYDMSSLNVCITGGSTMPPEFIPLFRDKFGVLLVEGYGLTEASPVCSVGRLDMPVKPGSIGIPIPGVRAGVVDEAGRELPTGGVGELVIRGPNLMQGYWNRPEATAEALAGGWFHTGDLARMDEEGDLTIVERKKDLFISGGENVYPAEVENVLFELSPVSEVAVIGIPDEKWGEVGRAVVVLKEGQPLGEAEILDHLRGRLARYKIPKSVVFVDRLPRNAAGKVLKTELRERLKGWGSNSKETNVQLKMLTKANPKEKGGEPWR